VRQHMRRACAGLHPGRYLYRLRQHGQPVLLRRLRQLLYGRPVLPCSRLGLYRLHRPSCGGLLCLLQHFYCLCWSDTPVLLCLCTGCSQMRHLVMGQPQAVQEG
jgi:hypothetical protein